MFLWLHHLLNPHCEECRLERESRLICSSCETLNRQLEIANYEKKQLLGIITDFNKPPELAERTQFNYDELKPRTVPWNVRKQMLEAEDRKKAQILRDASKNQSASIPPIQNITQGQTIKNSIEELEKALGITDEEGV